MKLSESLRGSCVHLILQKKKKNFYGLFLWMGFSCLKATEPVRGCSLLFTTKFPDISDTDLINLERMKG